MTHDQDKRSSAVHARLIRWVTPVLFAYSQILFTKNRWVGLLLVAATMTKPVVGLTALGAVLLSFAVVRAVGFSMDAARQGLYAYNPMIIGLTIGALFEPGLPALVLVVVAVVAVVFVQTAMESAVGYYFNLPTLSLPFVVVALVVLSAAQFFNSLHMVTGPSLWAWSDAPWLPEYLSLYLRSLGAIFFSPSVLAGLLVLMALTWSSRIAVVLSFMGFTVGWILLKGVFAFQSQLLALIVGYNYILTAIALGGIWFIPQLSSFVFALGAVVLAGLLVSATVVPLSIVRLPALILPFNVTILLALYAMRQRVRDSAPRSVNFTSGTPEQNLHYFRTRIERFGTRFILRLGLPFAGKWTVTQGLDGDHTHKGAWRHAFDFEVLDASGAKHAGAGEALSDYYCYRLPVLAMADGTVVKVINAVEDNPVGKRNPVDSWGNLVIIQHGVALYSVVAHLAPGTVDVVEGQFVRKGARVGLCGNSGRSFVPHLHVQLQATPRVGSPTREIELHDVVTEEQGAIRLHRNPIPEEGVTLRNATRDEALASHFAFPIGARFRFSDSRHPERSEWVVSRIDLYNNLYLESERTGARLFFENQHHQLLVYDYLGPRDGALFVMYAALSRVPFEESPDLSWDDVLSARRFRPAWQSWLHDLVDPFTRASSLHMAYHLTSEADGSAIHGAGSLGGQTVRTRAGLDFQGLSAVSLELGGHTRTLRLEEVEHAVG